jgi:hypothetical protein
MASEVFPRRGPKEPKSSQSARLTFTSPSETTGSRRALLDPPLMGFVAPLHQCHRERPLPGSRSRPSVLCDRQRIPFRPRGSSPPRRLAPPTALRVCLAPRPVLGFAPFPAPTPRERELTSRARSSPARQPSGVFPSPAAASRHVTVALLPSPSRADFRALLRGRVRRARPAVADSAPVTPLGFRPLQGVPLTTAAK